jgi:cystathionine beta-lyase
MSRFDEVINRKNTGSLKFDGHSMFDMPEDVLPLWVADMDFQTAPGITDVIKEAAEHGIFGYTAPGEAYDAAVKNWYQKHFDWDIQDEWIIKTPGVVFALATAVRAFTNPGDRVLIQRPVYYPFSSVVEDNERQVVNSPLKPVGDHYEMDFEDLEEKLADPQVKLMLLCSPHNPVGRVWTKEELCGVEEACLANDVILVSDEIHSDFVWGDRKHRILASLDKRLEENTVICTAPSKTFNLAGLQTSNIFIPNRDLRYRYKKAIERLGLFNPNQLGLAACRAAYETGEDWLAQVKEYILGNIEFTREYLQKNLPQIKLIEPEGTYLLWLDCRALGLSVKELNEKIIHDGKVWLDAGEMFGPEGEGFQRINVACPRKYLTQALEQMKRALVPVGIKKA